MDRFITKFYDQFVRDAQDNVKALLAAGVRFEFSMRKDDDGTTYIVGTSVKPCAAVQDPGTGEWFMIVFGMIFRGRSTQESKATERFG